MSDNSVSPQALRGAAGAGGWREAALVAAAVLALNLVGNGGTSLWDRDEPRYAGCTREMRARGDWVLPTFNGEPRYHKPVLIYWLMRAGYAAGGDNPFGARLVSALAGTATAVLVLTAGRRWLGPRGGRIAAVVLATAPITVIESKLATTDATLALFLTGCLFCLWGLARRDSWRLAAGFWGLMGLAVLTKGPVGPALVAAAGLASRAFGGPTVAWGRLRWRWGPALLLAVAAPWFVAVGLASRGEFFRYALGKQVAERVVSGMEQHGGFPGYYLASTLVLFHPWSALLPAALYGAWVRRRTDPDLGFLLGWAVGPLVLLECVRTKLVHYYLPAYPACALLTAWLVDGLIREGARLTRRPLGRLGIGLLLGVGVVLAGGFVAGAFLLPEPLRWPCLTVALVAGAGTLRGAWRFRGATAGRAVVGLAATWGVVMALVSGWLLPAAEPYRLSRVVGERLARIARETGTEPLLLSFQEPTMVYTMGRTAPMVRTWDRFYELLDRQGAVATALIPMEMAEFARRPELCVDILETVRGYNLNKGEVQFLRLAVIRRRSVAELAQGRTGGEKFRVK